MWEEKRRINRKICRCKQNFFVLFCFSFAFGVKKQNNRLKKKARAFIYFFFSSFFVCWNCCKERWMPKMNESSKTTTRKKLKKMNEWMIFFFSLDGKATRFVFLSFLKNFFVLKLKNKNKTNDLYEGKTLKKWEMLIYTVFLPLISNLFFSLSLFQIFSRSFLTFQTHFQFFLTMNILNGIFHWQKKSQRESSYSIVQHRTNWKRSKSINHQNWTSCHSTRDILFKFNFNPLYNPFLAVKWFDWKAKAIFQFPNFS